MIQLVTRLDERRAPDSIQPVNCLFSADGTRLQVLVFTRQALPQLPNTSIEGVAKGGYVIHDDPNPQIVFVASGSEVCVRRARAHAMHTAASFTDWAWVS
jgi:transketolase